MAVQRRYLTAACFTSRTIAKADVYGKNAL